MEAGEIALLTWLLHTARQPPPGHDSVKYGVDPPTVTKLYREYRGSGTILWDMIKDEKTTLRDMQGHFHRAGKEPSFSVFFQSPSTSLPFFSYLSR